MPRDDKITPDEFYGLSESFVLDMTALFRILEDEYRALLDKAISEGWTPEKLVYEMEKII